jgi:trehalose synthase
MALEEEQVASLSPGRFDDVLTADGLAQFQQAIRRGRELLDGRTFWNVNSTARGGGVAEMLRSLIGYTRGADIDARWVVIEGDDEFFAITKRLHNRLHGYRGDGGPLGDDERAVYERRCADNAAALVQQVAPDDVVLLHDPQTAGMVPKLVDAGVATIWRNHIGSDSPNDLAREAWRFLIPYVTPALAYVFSRESFSWEGLDEERIMLIPPSIDAFSPKNATMSFTGVTAVLRAAGLAAGQDHRQRAVFERLDETVGEVQRTARLIEEEPLHLDTPLVAQVSRWDRLKDPLGVLSAFAEHVDPAAEPHLVLAGPEVSAVADDPEGAEVLAETETAWRELPADVRRRVHLALLPMDDADENAVMVNALQRRADIVVQKSLAEGFGLTVAEAMWKGRPVVASAVGGIQDQIEDGVSGVLLDDATDLGSYGDAVVGLLSDGARAQSIGHAAQERVRNEFLPVRSLMQYLDLIQKLIA